MKSTKDAGATGELQRKVRDAGIDASLLRDASFSPEQQEYLTNRWLHEVSWFAKATRTSRRLFAFFSVVAVLAGALTACAAGLNVFIDDRSIRWLVAGLGVLTAVTTGLSTHFRDWENWKRRSMTVERLKSEGRQFLVRAGRYKSFSTREEGFTKFVERVEGIVSDHKLEFFAKRPGEGPQSDDRVDKS